MKYCICIGLCFATHNILSDYGKSGGSNGGGDNVLLVNCKEVSYGCGEVGVIGACFVD